MNLSTLCETVRGRLAEVFENAQLPSESRGNRSAPTIFNAYLPPKRSSRKDVDTDFPFVIVRPSEGKATLDGSTAKVRLIIGVRSLDDDAVEYLYLLEGLIRRALFERPMLGVFTFEQKYDWVLFDDQQNPFYEMIIDTEWSMYHPQLEGEDFYV